jgi:AcrR family transcriptional regulator
MLRIFLVDLVKLNPSVSQVGFNVGDAEVACPGLVCTYSGSGLQGILIVHMCVLEFDEGVYITARVCAPKFVMARKYTQKKRAEQQGETRRRIAQAALDLHRQYGPARTTVSMVAARADVQRHTLYSHFPDERSLLQACSGLHLEQDPPPDAVSWSSIANHDDRLTFALSAIYAWYERNADLIAAVLRDAEVHEATREIVEVRLGPAIDAWRASLSDVDDPPQRKSMLGLALSFYSWRTLSREAGPDQAARLMVQAVMSAEVR